MIAFKDLVSDTRLVGHSNFVMKIISTYNLSDTQIEELNNPSIKKVESPYIDKIIDFIRNSERLIVCGDYDADGVCATAIAMMLAKECGVESVGHYIPNRFKEGYGVSLETIRLAHEKHYTDVLIVDNGVKSQAAVDLALSLGLRVAIVDHHIRVEPLPKCDMLHPDYLDSYANVMSATGLMFLVAENMGLLNPKIYAYSAIATIADVMPLWGKNREIVLRGIEALNTNKILNIDALWKRYGNTAYDAKTLSFQVIPKINAIGRMADIVNMNTMVTYLLEDNPKNIQAYAKQVNDINDIRKQKGKDTQALALNYLNDDPFQIIIHKDFHEGLMGIVANQIMSTVSKPTIVFKETDTILKGSARSSTISLEALFTQLDSKYFEAFGGHDFAFGLSLKKEYLEDFKNDILRILPTLKDISKDKKAIYFDEAISPSDIDSLKALEPYGQGFEPIEYVVDKFKIKEIQALNGFGYKLIFDNYWLKDAVLFKTNIDVETLYDIKMIQGTLDNHPRFGLSFSITSYRV